MCRGGGGASGWVVLGLDPACPEPDTELQLRAAVLLILTWDIRSRAGVRSTPSLCPVLYLPRKCLTICKPQTLNAQLLFSRLKAYLVNENMCVLWYAKVP